MLEKKHWMIEHNLKEGENQIHTHTHAQNTHMHTYVYTVIRNKETIKLAFLLLRDVSKKFPSLIGNCY